ncbi:MAG: hypothetical protein AzoDbin1_00326, partial [Azoarcus sp.]|nr:hypothetical protein [Azoarcus sp.]
GDWLHGNMPLALGMLPDQLRQAADYYLQIKASAPAGATISFTGHSLGGGLASLMAVMFGESAFTFDQAPFRSAALMYRETDPNTGIVTTHSVAQDLLAYLQSETTNGQPTYTAEQLKGLTNFISVLNDAASGVVPNEGNVTDINVSGEILAALPFGRIGTQTDIPQQNNMDLVMGSVNLHSQALLTAFLQSNQTADANRSLSDVTFKLNDFLKMIFDSNLFANDPNNLAPDAPENFLERLVKHQATVIESSTGATDAMLARFTADLWQLAQDGGMTMQDGLSGSKWVNNALIAFAMQKYYEETAESAGYKKTLFTDLTTAGEGGGGIRFDMADVSTNFSTAFAEGKQLNLSDAKGFEKYFKYYLDNNLDLGDANFVATEDQLILSMLSTLRDWYVQAGSNGMIATDTQNRGAFMLGGTGSDQMNGGDSADFLVGNAGDDTLQGGKGADILLGGTGNDIYVYKSGDGSDLILDRDGYGSLKIDDQTMAGGDQYGDERVYKGADANGQKHTYVYVTGNASMGGDLLVDNSILIKSYDPAAGNKMGMSWNVATPDAAPATNPFTLPGDYIRTDEWKDANYVVIGSIIVYGNMTVYTDLGGAVVQNLYFQDTAGNDAITTGAQRDYINLISGGAGAGDDVISSGGGQDYVYAGSGNDVIVGGESGDFLYGGSGDDRIYGATRITVEQAVVNGNQDDNLSSRGDWLSGGSGEDTLVGSATRDLLFGGGGEDLLIAGAGDDLISGDAVYEGIYFNLDPLTSQFVFNGTSYDWSVTDLGGYRRHIDLVTNEDGYTSPDGAADAIYAGKGDDFLVGGLGNDILFGEAGEDTLWGDGFDNGTPGNDYLDGGLGNDVLLGNGGDDVLVGGKGDDTIYGGEGNDTYIYNVGDGIDTLYDDFTTPGANTLRFGEGVDKDNIILRKGSLLLDLGNGDQIHIEGFNSQDVFNSSAIGRFQFADGTSLSVSELLARGFDLDGTGGIDTLYGTNTVDRITGFGGNDTLAGLGGADILNGGDGADLLIGDADNLPFEQHGNDILDGGAGNDQLLGGGGSDSLYGGADNDQLWGDDGALAESNHGDDVLDGGDGNDQLVGQGGSDTLIGGAGDDQLWGDGNADPLYEGNDHLYGGAGDDQLVGGGGSDILDGGSGNDTLFGDAGNDTYLLAIGAGLDVIAETGGQDQVVFDATVLPESLEVRRDGTNLIAAHANGSDEITFKDWFANADGRAFVEEIRFANGTIWTAEALTRQVLTQEGADQNDRLTGIDLFGDSLVGGGGEDDLFGLSGNDTLEGGTGNDRLYGGGGDDLYVYRPGGGNDTIYDDSGTDTLRIEGTLSAQFNRSGDSLNITLSDGATIELGQWFSSYGPKIIERIEFGNGTVVTADELNQVLLRQTGTAGPDTIYGTGLSDTVFGGAGNDTAYGSSGDDFLYGEDGHDSLSGSDGNDLLDSGLGDDVLDGGSGNDLLLGGDGSDVLQGGLGADTLDGGSGDNYLFGGDGADTYLNAGQGQVRIRDSSGSDTLRFLPGITPEQLVLTRIETDLKISVVGRADTVTLVDWFLLPRNSVENFIFSDGRQWLPADLDRFFNRIDGSGALMGTNGDDLLYGGTLDDELQGGAGNDFLDGGVGADTLAGGPGDDTYLARSNDTLVELAGEGTDTLVWANSAAITLPENFENLRLAEIYLTHATGNGANNLIIGNEQNNTIDGAAGADTMEGGLGSDIYYVDNVGDVMVERPGQGDDHVNASVSYALAANLESLTLTGAATEGVGNDLNNILRGNDNDNRLVGNDGNDYMYAYFGADTLVGGAGDDHYYVNDSDDVIIEDVGGGYDELHIESATAWRDQRIFTMVANLEAVSLRGNVFDATVFGNDLNNVIDARGVDIGIDGRKMDLYGGAGDDVIYGSNCGGVLDGGAGNDIMYGGSGQDDFYVDSELDQVIESTSSGTYADSVYAPFTYTLGANIENLYLTGSANLSGFGNGLDNTLGGNSGNNYLFGGAGDDRLIGGGGVDTLVGGLGNDTYVLSSLNEVIVELDNEGNDGVETATSYTLGATLENLTLTGSAAASGTGNAADNRLTGNSANNKLTGYEGNDSLNGGAGNDTLIGGAGDDIYVVDTSRDVITELVNEGTDSVEASYSYTLGANLENLTLTGYSAINGTGNAGANRLTGNYANNTLTGGAGNDTLEGMQGTDSLVGGLGSDIYVFGRGYSADTISENDTTAGNTDIAQFLAGIDEDQLWFRLVGNGKTKSLEISILGTTDKITIANWTGGNQYHVEQFKTADGKTLLDSQVQNLVTAMASFSAPPAGTTLPLDPSYDAVRAAIAANWQ